jgi:thioredoxin 1
MDYGPEPSRNDIDALDPPTVVEFGANYCGHCKAAQPLIAAAFAAHPRVARIKVEDARRRPLGRSFQVKLWPTLIFLSNGKEVARLVRPTDVEAIERALALIDFGPPADMPPTSG